MENKEVNSDLTHSPETAGHLMTSKIPVVRKSMTIAELEAYLLKETVNFESINYIYIVDEGRTLEGVLSIKEMFRLSKSTIIGDAMVSDVVCVRSHTDQERVAYVALKHNLKAVPVVDKDNKFLGVITPDVILRILDKESVEDILRFGGISRFGRADDIFKLSILRSLMHRLPWLLLGLLGGIVAAGVVKGFESTLSENLLLAAFIPLIVYMADAVGTQMEAFIIRDLALDPKLNFLSYFFKQLIIVGMIGIVASLLIFGTSYFLYHELMISIVLGVALFFAVVSSIITGLAIPVLFSKLNLDPANASGPTATIIQDVMSVLVYLSVARWLL